jgi:hypothetical protein
MLETLRFLFDPIHQDDAVPGKCVVVQFADRLAGHFAPCEALLI